MTTQEKTKAVYKHYKELNSDLEFNYENGTMYTLENQDVVKTLRFMALHADAVLIADTFIGRHLFNIAEDCSNYYALLDFLTRYDFNECKVQIYIRCDFGFQALLIAIS